MTIGISTRQRQNNAVVSTKTTVVTLPPNTNPGESEELIGRVAALAGFQPSSILLSNNSISAVYLRGVDVVGFPNPSVGVVISPNGSIFLPIVSAPADLGIENGAPVYILCYE